jgi:hypothetical protein
MNKDLKLAGIAVAALAVGGLILKKKIDDAGGVPGFFQDVGSTAVSAVGGAAGGVVMGIGDQVGIPRTNMNACELAIAEGRTWDASFACPAGRFIEYLSTGK